MKERQIRRKGRGKITASTEKWIPADCTRADGMQPYMVGEVSIHDNNEIPSGILHPMDVGSAWWKQKQLPWLFWHRNAQRNFTWAWALPEMSLTKQHLHSGAPGTRLGSNHHQSFTPVLGSGQHWGPGLRFCFRNTLGFLCAFLKLVCLQTTWWKCVSAFGLYCDFFWTFTHWINWSIQQILLFAFTNQS